MGKEENGMKDFIKRILEILVSIVILGVVLLGLAAMIGIMCSVGYKAFLVLL